MTWLLKNLVNSYASPSGAPQNCIEISLAGGPRKKLYWLFGTLQVCRGVICRWISKIFYFAMRDISTFLKISMKMSFLTKVFLLLKIVQFFFRDFDQNLNMPKSGEKLKKQHFQKMWIKIFLNRPVTSLWPNILSQYFLGHIVRFWSIFEYG